MLTKFETKSNRVKGLSFHASRPWILCSLHNGVIQLWDYRMGTLIDRFDEHDGPVRGINFHVTQPLFVSGGDDYKLKVWNYKLRRCMFTLLGHLDYIRTVQFHSENPWIASASDDQTIRVWNWISRTCITVLTGHNHYVMSAQFHPKEELVVSSSLDQTVRVWDISGLKRKSSGGPADPPGARADLFGTGDAVVKYVLEGHDRGVNWASFHPSLPLIVSGADDRQVKLWRMNETKAWEVDTLRGHVNNVSCVLFHPRLELIISNSEDKSIRVWDMSKRTAIATFRREHDRFWIMTAHPNQNLLAAGHDSGMIVYKLERERPAQVTHEGCIYYVKEKNVRCFTVASQSDVPLVQLRRRDTTAPPPRSISFNPSDSGVLITSESDGGTYELYAVETKGGGGDGYRGQGLSAVFVARNRFAVLDKNHSILIKDLRNETSKQIAAKDLPNGATADFLFPATPGCCLIRSEEKITLFDVQQRKVMGELTAPMIKRVVWSDDLGRVALLSKHAIIIANKKLGHVCTVHETIRIKSGAWHESGIFLYTTLNHIKFCLPNGDNGIIKTLDQPIYLSMVEKDAVVCLDRDAMVRRVPIDPTEMIFKLKLVQRKYPEVISMIKTARLCGQAIIGYLQQKGFPEIALHFVGDERTKFGLALESSNIDVAWECAAKLDEPDLWTQLANVALKSGNVGIAEKCYMKTKNFERLSFLCLVTGQTDKLQKMMKIAENHGDTMGWFQNALYLGNVQERVKLLQNTNQDVLAMLAAVNHGLDEDAATIGERLGEDLAIFINPDAELLAPPIPIYRETSWPMLEIANTRAFNLDDPVMEMEDETENTAWDDSGSDTGAGGAGGADEPAAAAESDGENDWDNSDDDMEIAAPMVDDGYYVPPSAGQSMGDKWAMSSQLAAEHVAGGHFDSAMGLLREQLGLTNFGPMKDVFLQTYAAARAQLPTLPGLNPLGVALADSSFRPMLYLDKEKLAPMLQAAYDKFKGGKFADVILACQGLLLSYPLVVVENRQQVPELQSLRDSAREYVLAAQLFLGQKAETDPGRKAELGALMTHCNLKPPHLALALRQAMKLCMKISNYQHGGAMARRLLELNPAPAHAQEAKKVLMVADRNPRNELSIDYDERNPFVICASTLKPIFRGNPTAKCGVCGASTKPASSGELCKVCTLGSIGAPSSGISCVRQEM